MQIRIAKAESKHDKKAMGARVLLFGSVGLRHWRTFQPEPESAVHTCARIPRFFFVISSFFVLLPIRKITVLLYGLRFPYFLCPFSIDIRGISPKYPFVSAVLPFFLPCIRPRGRGRIRRQKGHIS